MPTCLAQNLNKGDEAVTVLKDVIARQKRLYGENSSSVAVALITLGQTYSQLNRSDDAITTTKSACDIMHKIHTRPHQDLMACSAGLGYLYGQTKDKLGLAAASYTDAAQVAAALDGENSSDARVMRAELAETRIHQVRLEDAAQLLSALYRTGNQQTAEAAAQAFEYADVLHKLHRNADATAVLDRIEPTLKKNAATLPDKLTEVATLRKAIAEGK